MVDFFFLDSSLCFCFFLLPPSLSPRETRLVRHGPTQLPPPRANHVPAVPRPQNPRHRRPRVITPPRPCLQLTETLTLGKPLTRTTGHQGRHLSLGHPAQVPPGEGTAPSPDVLHRSPLRHGKVPDGGRGTDGGPHAPSAAWPEPARGPLASALQKHPRAVWAQPAGEAAGAGTPVGAELG